MTLSVFKEKPAQEDLERCIGPAFSIWEEIRCYVLSKNPDVVEEWHTSGKKYGWTFRIKDRKRAIVYFIPTLNSFKLGFVLGGKATDKALTSTIDSKIKDIIRAAPVYAEGRGFRIDWHDIKNTEDIKVLLQIKMAP